MAAPEYKANASGDSYGSAALAPEPELELDLIEALATNGASGYVLKVDLDKANGSAAAATFKSPEEALAWQASQGEEPVIIDVYTEDGKTVVGEFVVTFDR